MLTTLKNFFANKC